MRINRMPKLAVLSLATALIAIAADPGAEAASYASGDVFYVVYQPHGAEVIVNVGPGSEFTASGAVPFTIQKFQPQILLDVFGDPLPTNLRVALFASDGQDGYLSTNGPKDTNRIGSALGASNQIEAFGSAWAVLSNPVLSSPDTGTYDFGFPTSYQATLDGASIGSLGGNVPFSVETSLSKAPVVLNLFSGRSNPFSGDPPQQRLVGRFTLAQDGSLVYYPARTIIADCVANPQTLSTRSNGHGFSFDVTLTDVTDPLNPINVVLAGMDAAHISQAGSTSLPAPRSDAGCDSFTQDGLWEDVSRRTLTGINFDLPSDGVCSTLDGDRQDLLSVIGDVLDGSFVPVCIGTGVELNPVSCCSMVRVLNRGNR